MCFRWGGVSTVILRYALGVGFLSAVADRLGLWGPFGQANAVHAQGQGIALRPARRGHTKARAFLR